MPAADFAAAQERIALRRAQRAAAARSHDAPQPSRALTRLPFPFNRLSTAGLSAWDAIKGRGGTRPEFRVGQVDAELLDDELLELLKGQVGEALKYFGTHITDTYSAEILLALRAVLWKLSIWNNNASYGAHLQGLRYTDARSRGLERPPPKPWQKVAYGAVTIGGRYCWSKWESYLLSASEDYAAPENPRLAVLSRLTEQLSNLHDIASLASFLVFLVNGRYRTLTDRLLRLRLTPTSHSTSREVSFEYLNRQLVWHAFTEFLLFLLPLVGISRWRRILSRSLRRLASAFWTLLGRHSTADSGEDGDEKKAGELAFLPERTCAICYRDQNPTSASEADVLAASTSGGGVVGSAATDITNPYAADCACVYCFACIAQRIANEEGEGWPCLRCGEVIKTCRPWDGDVLAPTRRTQSSSHGSDRATTREGGKSVLFAQDENESGVEESLQHIEPMPEPQGDEHGHDEAVDVTADALLEKTRGLDLGESLAFTERDEWARESERSSDDEQSEEYDEDEEQEGEELEYDL
ncbi:peroxisome assembly protein (Peroxin-2) [Didymella heteroderae]|uniref:Peroxisome assembly protein (Peroxin-2) n=1 Tax=Didymella heteroderae TaxID=1769908 RepID=A0A9P4WLI1_9PLEO|nr:peroxisome assembly protein (Peroxin-2) [Didymella heteroderae]